MAGVFTSNLVVDLESITFPEFMKNRTYDKVEGRLLHQPCRYDIIFGRDALSKFGITLDFDKHQLDMDGATLSMRNFPAQPGAGEPTIAEAFFVDSLDDDLWDAFDSDSVPSLADASSTPIHSSCGSTVSSVSLSPAYSVDTIAFFFLMGFFFHRFSS